MSFFEDVMLGMLGFFVGNLLFARGVAVVGTAWEIAQNKSFTGGAKSGQCKGKAP